MERRYTIFNFDNDGNNPVESKASNAESAVEIAEHSNRWVVWTPAGDVVTNFNVDLCDGSPDVDEIRIQLKARR